MYYYYKQQIKIKNGAITVDYKSLTSQAFTKPVTEQQVCLTVSNTKLMNLMKTVTSMSFSC